jgi:hypothetical protein
MRLASPWRRETSEISSTMPREDPPRSPRCSRQSSKAELRTTLFGLPEEDSLGWLPFVHTLRKISSGTPEAARIQKEVAEVLWPQAIAEYAKLQNIHADFRATVQKIQELNGQIVAQVERFNSLTGDAITPVPQVFLWNECVQFCQARLGSTELPPGIAFSTPTDPKARPSRRNLIVFRRRETGYFWRSPKLARSLTSEN